LAQTVNGNNNSYLDVVELAADTPIILHDDDWESERGWMVPALSIILYMIHIRAAQKDVCNGQIPYAELTWKAGEAVRDVLMQKWGFVLHNTPSEETYKKKLVKNLEMQYWHDIHHRAGEDLKPRCESNPGAELGPLRLYGWGLPGYSERKKIAQEAAPL
jgi:hypothetical protein